jgi:hypothetical protein
MKKLRQYMISGGARIIEEKGMVFLEDSPEVLLCQEILEELQRAENIHPNWPTDPVHAGAILAEEAGEVVKAINNVVTKHKGESDYATEAIQCAAMCIRFLKNIDKYDWGIKY